MSDNFGGKYKHYKGGTYRVFCKSIDERNQEFVLYMQLYGNSRRLWVRPIDMFFSEVTVEGKKKSRFIKTKQKESIENNISELVERLASGEDIIFNTEKDSIKYYISQIKKGVAMLSEYHDVPNGAGYLTDLELLKRQGYFGCVIDGQLIIKKSKRKIPDAQRLIISDYNELNLQNYLNPASIDLQIADTGFLRNRRRALDPEALQHYSGHSELWKNVKLKKSKTGANDYFYIRPKETILAHTKAKISIPLDCAGKIEIKSTYARLAISITFSDFCNPGYEGYFPLQITNNSNRKIAIHTNSVMCQLMLIPLSGNFLLDYKSQATHINNSGVDNGLPYKFSRERAIENIRKTDKSGKVLATYEKICGCINPSMTEDVNAYRERFEKTFLKFSEKRLSKESYKMIGSNEIDSSLLVSKYISQEKVLEFLTRNVWLPCVAYLFDIGFIIFQVKMSNNSFSQYFTPTRAIIGILLVMLLIVVGIMRPKEFCTFKRIDIKNCIQED